MPISDTFTLFPLLPTEIRLMIWRLCLPCRIVELDFQQDDLIWDDDATCTQNWRIQNTNKSPPLIASVCREARDVAFETGSILQYPDLKQYPDAGDFTTYMVQKPWLDPARDSVAMNWYPACDVEFMTWDMGDPIRCLMYYASLTQSKTASINMGVLLDTREERDEHYRWTREELADLMRAKQRWSVVLLNPVIIHADARDAAGFELFGLLADARVQHVAVQDKVRIKEFMDLAERSKYKTASGPMFDEERVEEAKGQLREAAIEVFGSEEQAPKFDPVVEFRLCTRCVDGDADAKPKTKVDYYQVWQESERLREQYTQQREGHA